MFAKLSAVVVGLTALAPMIATAHPYVRPPPSGFTAPRGHYETRLVQQFVPATIASTFVPGQCRYSRWRHAEVCRAGRYVRQWVPAHDERVPQQVWVADGGYGYGYTG